MKSDTFKNRKSLLSTMGLTKRGQLGFIEFKYLMIGVLLGLLMAFVLVYLGTTGTLPFKIPFVCG